MPTKEQKFRFLKRVYFGVSDNPTDDVNPFNNLQEFGTCPVGEMRWGVDLETRRKSKIRFAYNYSETLRFFKVLLPVEEVYTNLIDDKTNDEVITLWTDVAEFKKSV